MADDKSIKAQNSLVRSEKRARYEINLQTLKGIRSFDFNQAKSTWEALEKAGLPAGELVAWSLNFGHDYHIDEIPIPPQSFRDLKSQIGESRTSDNTLVGYQVVERLSLGFGLDTEDQEIGLIVQPKSLIQAEEIDVVEDPKNIKIIAIFKEEDKLQISSTSAEQPKTIDISGRGINYKSLWED